jgi:hypothetical protein
MRTYCKRTSDKPFFDREKSCRKRIFLLAGITIAFLVVFITVMRVPASADSGSYTEMKRYETCLIREGDTLSAIAEVNASRLSHITVDEYIQRIMELNNMDSEYITAGHYILLPDYIG